MANAKFTLIPEQPSAPKLIGPVPGPKAKRLVERDKQVLSSSYTRDYPLVIDKAVGSVVIDPDGNRFLDMTAGIAVTATGHSHPYVVEAIQRQAARFLHMSGTDFYYDQEIELAERLAKLAPMSGRNRVFFTNSGAEAIEAAFKLARHQTGRQHVIAFWGAFHGRTFGAMSLSGSKAIHRKRFLPVVPQITHVTYPDPFRPYEHCDAESIVDFTINEIERTVFRREVSPDEVAAVFVEAIQGEGGYIVPPPEFLPKLRDLCNRHGILLVCDEVQSGMGRTGKMWAVEHVGV
ncbi:MAG: aminotransferase class III-fold pyridoxal phosphate-dependent enzyme, partial [Pirellulales bacterium]|nr:aminotransferase class III-fold pyridoxal phosphate-dependent enzyme [Pirellulales bacterium]